MPALVSLFKNICFRASRYNERVFDKMSGPLFYMIQPPCFTMS